MHPCLEVLTRDFGTCILFALMCTLHVYKPTVRLVASSTLFLDIQVMTLLLREFTLFANFSYPTTRPQLYFSTIFVAHLHVYTPMMGCKRSCSYNKDFKVNKVDNCLGPHFTHRLNVNKICPVVCEI